MAVEIADVRKKSACGRKGIAPGDTLLSSLERNGIVLLSNCRAGECAYCRTKLLAGNVVYPRTTWIRKADVASRYIHPCVAYPISDVVLRIHTALEK